jgi:hypothetical protein
MSDDKLAVAHSEGRLRGVLAARDAEAAADRASRVAELPTAAQPVGSADMGARGERVPTGASRADLARMSPEEIVAAHRVGLLDHLLGIEPKPAAR